MASVRLDKLLANRTAHSRTEIRSILKLGAVQVDGVTVTDGTLRIDPAVQEVTCEGRRLPGGTHTYFIVNKPQGYICATEDRDHPTVLTLLPPALRVKGLFPAGRLDADSTGLVLLTDDGALAHRMLSPKHHVPKYYLIRLARPCTPGQVQQITQGITLSDGTQCMPAFIRPAGECSAVICLHEGRYHQVKRMLAAVGNHVENLHRAAIGGMLLPPDLALGAHLEIFNKDVENMLEDSSPDVIYERIVSSFSSYLINEGR